MGRATAQREVPLQSPSHFWMRKTNEMCPIYLFLSPCLGTKNKILANWRLIWDLVFVCVCVHVCGCVLCLAYTHKQLAVAISYLLRLHRVFLRNLFFVATLRCLSPSSCKSLCQCSSCSVAIGRVEAGREEELAKSPWRDPNSKVLIGCYTTFWS